MKEVSFSWKRKKPEDFIVKEVSEIPLDSSGNHYFYLLVKRNLSTKEICRKYSLSYAGMKDKLALTSQKVSSEKFLGNFIRESNNRNSWFILKYLGKARKKLKIGQLKGNRFAVNVSGFTVKEVSVFINYYDVQRISGNWRRGKELLLELVKKPRRKLSWTQNFLIDSYLSYLWNRSLELYLKEQFTGYYVVDGEEKFFIPEGLDLNKLPKFWTVLGYRKKLLESEEFYRKSLEEEGFNMEDFLNLLKTLGIKGDYRMTYVIPREVRKIGNYLLFFLPKGSFATMFLKHILS